MLEINKETSLILKQTENVARQSWNFDEEIIAEVAQKVFTPTFTAPVDPDAKSTGKF